MGVGRDDERVDVQVGGARLGERRVLADDLHRTVHPRTQARALRRRSDERHPHDVIGAVVIRSIVPYRGRSPTVTVSSVTTPPRNTWSGTARPTRSPSSRSSSSSGESTAWPSNWSSTSPTSTPAAAAGL